MSQLSQVPFRLQPFYEAIHRDLDHVVLAVTPDATFSVLDPPLRREVGRFGDVEPRVEPAVVAHRKCDHEFALFLNNLQIMCWYRLLANDNKSMFHNIY